VTMGTATETRWIVLGTDGRHVSLGRGEPSEAEIATVSDAIAAFHAARRRSISTDTQQPGPHFGTCSRICHANQMAEVKMTVIRKTQQPKDR
jgi:hypothetical protein